MRSSQQGLVIVGAGPGGLAPLFAAADAGKLPELLEHGVTILERSETLGRGTLGQYSIHSDSSAEALLDIVMRTQQPELSALHTHPVVARLRSHGKNSAPLTLVAEFLEVAGRTLCDIVAATPRGRVVSGAQVSEVQQTLQGSWKVRFHIAGCELQMIEAQHVLLATGATQPEARLGEEPIAGEVLLPRFRHKLLQSGQVLARDGAATVTQRLGSSQNPRVVIVGGSTSAGSVALKLLEDCPEVAFNPGAITLLHRQPLRIFYESVEEALMDGYTEFGGNDVCPITGRVFRLSGFRLDSRELIMGVRGIGDRAPEPRLSLLQLGSGQDDEARVRLEEADLIIAALGYRPRLVPVLDAHARPVRLHQPQGAEWAVVDAACRVRSADGASLEGLFAMGLAVGPVASRELGGEAGFLGQVNSLWLWQHTLGLLIANQVIANLKESRPTSSSVQFAPLAATPLREKRSTRQFHPEVAGAA